MLPPRRQKRRKVAETSADTTSSPSPPTKQPPRNRFPPRPPPPTLQSSSDDDHTLEFSRSGQSPGLDDIPFTPVPHETLLDLATAVDNLLTPTMNNPSSTDHDDDDDAGEQLVHDISRAGPGYDPSARPHVCDFEHCRKAFARRSDLARHQKIHTNDRAYTCTVADCGKAFIQRSALTVHIRTHTGEKPHECESCERCFADSSSLARHRRTHTGNRPYACRICGNGKSFARRNTYLKHFRRAHPELPAPSTDAVRHKIHFPVSGSKASRGSSFRYEPGPVGPDGKPAYYLSTPTSSSTPHGVAAPYPSEAAAFAFDGGVQPTAFIGVGGSIRYAGDGLGSEVVPRVVRNQSDLVRQQQQQQRAQRAFKPYHRASPTAFTRPPNIDTQRRIGDQAPDSDPSLQTPLSACPSISVQSDITTSTIPSPGLSGSGAFNGSSTSTDAQSSSIGGGRSTESIGAVGSSQHFNGQPVFPPHGYSFAKPQPGMMWIRSDNGQMRSVSAPLPYYSQPYASAPYGGVGGGFAPGQLSFPPNHQAFITSSYQSSTSVPVSANRSAAGARVEPPSNDTYRDGSPELVDITSVPSFQVHPPQHSSMPPPPMPYTAVGTHQLYSHPQPSSYLNLATPHPGRIHSAPAFMQRFHSTPVTPTESPWTEIEPFSGPGGYGDAHSIGGGRSGTDEEWEEMEDMMLSRHASEGPEEKPKQDQTSAFPVLSSPMALSSEQKKPTSKWGPPISYPVPPRQNVAANVFSSSASSVSSSSTLVAPSAQYMTQGNGALSPIPMLPAGPTTTSMSYQHGQVAYPTPISPYHNQFSDHKAYHGQNLTYYPMLAPPPTLYPGSGQYGSMTMPPNSPVDGYGNTHMITLSSPPRPTVHRTDTATSVGLGLANVYFDDRNGAIVEGVEGDDKADNDKVVKVFNPDEEGEEELSDKDFDIDVTSDDSDDEFVLGGRRKAVKKKAKKVKAGRRFSVSRKKARGPTQSKFEHGRLDSNITA